MITKPINKPGKWPFSVLVSCFFVLHGFKKATSLCPCSHYGAKNTVLSCCNGIFVPKYLLNITGKVFMLLMVS